MYRFTSTVQRRSRVFQQSQAKGDATRFVKSSLLSSNQLEIIRRYTAGYIERRLTRQHPEQGSRMLLSSLKLLLFTPVLLAAGHSPNSFHESLTLHPLPDGKLSVLFEFTTYFTQTKSTVSIRKVYHWYYVETL